MRVGRNGENLKNLSDKKSNSLKVKGVSLKKKILSAIETIEHSLDLLGYSYDNHLENVKDKCLPKLKIQILNLQEVNVEVIPTGLEIILVELLKNALFNTNHRNPEVSIEITQSNTNQSELHIVNNEVISDKYLAYLKSEKTLDGVATQYKAGIRTIKRIINFPLFNRSESKWSLGVNPSENSTDLFLTIPNDDII